MDTGTTAFMLCCIIGLTLMIPGLALFYGGMVSVKSSTNMMMMTFGAVAAVGLLWVLFALFCYSLELDRLGRALTGLPPLPLEEGWVG